MINGVTEATTNRMGQSAAMEGLDRDAFLQMLVAQMRYQNPLSPVDGQEYLAQAAQFAQMERLEQLAQGQHEAVAYQQILLSSSLVGKTVVGAAGIGGGPPITGVVSSVRFTDGVPTLVVGNDTIAIGDVEEVIDTP